MAIYLNEDDVRAIQRVLVDLLVRSESDCCLLCDSGGNVMAHEGMDPRSDPFLISALGAGVFAASRELARLLGENEFSAVFHQGEKKSIFIRAVDHDVLLVNIFSRSGSLGLVKLYATPAAHDLALWLAGIRVRPRAAGRASSPAFQAASESAIFSAVKPSSG